MRTCENGKTRTFYRDLPDFTHDDISLHELSCTLESILYRCSTGWRHLFKQSQGIYYRYIVKCNSHFFYEMTNGLKTGSLKYLNCNILFCQNAKIKVFKILSNRSQPFLKTRILWFHRNLIIHFPWVLSKKSKI